MRPFHTLVLALLASASFAAARAQSPASVPALAVNTIVGPVMYVTDVGRSLKFYRDVLGMKVRGQFGPADKPSVSLGFSDDPHAPTLMLLSDREGPTPRAIEHGHGYDRLALHVSDLPAIQARLRAAGFTTTDIRKSHETHQVVWTNDPDGYKVEIVQ